ncbi:MAG: hypothetical protein IPO30_16365 [Hyphomonadaceae bacterium]|nr:hypothetical protein [Hyphomonadaceae bacterium]
MLTQQKLEDLVYHNRYSAAERQEAGASKLDKASSDKLLSDKNPARGYNRFWMDPGSTYAPRQGRVPLIPDHVPENGRIPYTDAGISANVRATNSVSTKSAR